MSLVVLEPGLASRIVDMGRPRTRSLGVPVGGAADRCSLILGNSLLGNPPDAAALEIALKGPRLRADANTACVLFGARFEAQCNGHSIEIGQTFTLRAGEELQIGGVHRPGTRVYLCVRGGFQTPTILNSKSSLEPIHQGELLRSETSNIHSRCCPELWYAFPYLSALWDLIVWNDDQFDTWRLSVLPGLQASWFDENEFLEQYFLVSPVSNRMGLRLRGLEREAITMPDREMVSEPVCPGAVQVTRDGQCIVLGVDGQTIGGYPKIAQVIQADLDLLGQLRPGEPMKFRKVTLEEAIKRNRQKQEKLRYWGMRLSLSLDAFPRQT